MMSSSLIMGNAVLRTCSVRKREIFLQKLLIVKFLFYMHMDRDRPHLGRQEMKRKHFNKSKQTMSRVPSTISDSLLTRWGHRNSRAQRLARTKFQAKTRERPNPNPKAYKCQDSLNQAWHFAVAKAKAFPAENQRKNKWKRSTYLTWRYVDSTVCI